MRGVTRAVRDLRWRDRLEVVIAVAVAAFVEVGIRCLQLPTLARILGMTLDTGEGPSQRMTSAPPAWALRRLDLSRGVLRHWPGGNTCLRRSLVMGNRVRRLHPKLRVGVARRNDALAAHAWLEFDGWYFDADAAQYQSVRAVPPR